jgi:elongator complex protein 2
MSDTDLLMRAGLAYVNSMVRGMVLVAAASPMFAIFLLCPIPHTTALFVRTFVEIKALLVCIFSLNGRQKYAISTGHRYCQKGFSLVRSETLNPRFQSHHEPMHNHIQEHDHNDKFMTMTERRSDVNLDFIAAGGNRHPSAADWASHLLAFGSGNNIALWNTADRNRNGVSALLAGHTDLVNTVKIYEVFRGPVLIISGAADKTIRIWGPSGTQYKPWCSVAAHEGSVTCIAADGTLKVWEVVDGGSGVRLVQTIALKPRFLPLSMASTMLVDGTAFLAVAGTMMGIQLFSRPADGTEFVLQATLTGHEGWIRALDFVHDGEDLLLASGSQDKYIRLWRFSRSTTSDGSALSNGDVDPAVAGAKKSLSNKAHQVGREGAKYNVTFEALLIGHEDWVYTTRWAPKTATTPSPTLLSASADNSLAIWQADEASGVWICNARLGEISAQKGSTTATGSTGGFWIGLWQLDAQSVVSLGRTGSWRRWSYDAESDSWKQQIGISGHVREVQSLAWAPDGSYLLTTSSDQTTRLFAEWKRGEKRSWHEFARPQIHGYDLNCIDSLGRNQFISGADEKLLRVFNKPKAIDHLMSKLCEIASTVEGELAVAANIPVLGLSNKAIAAIADDEPTEVHGSNDDREAVDPALIVRKSTLDLDHPPLEEHLARHTLWPEQEKLYGHGYEISAVAASHDGSLVATACKASSIDHAVIRLYETKEWRGVKPPLTAHSLTMTSLAFSGDDRYLLSVGRDRQWAIFERNSEDAKYVMLTSNPKGHARMILDCSWAPNALGYVFATAGRDKNVKIWRMNDGQAECVATLCAALPVTAVAFALEAGNESTKLALGTEDGGIQITDVENTSLQTANMSPLEPALCPSGAVNQLCWRPSSEPAQLAVASDDGSVRIYNVKK